MLRAILDAGRPVRVLSFGIRFPGIRDRVVPVHWRAFLLADAVIVKVLAGQAVGLLGTDTASGAEQMAAFSGVRAEAPTLMTLRRAVDLRELLAVVGTFTPASAFAGRITGRTLSFRVGKVVLINHLELGTGQDLFPVDVAHMAEVVVVEEANRAAEDIAQRRHLQVLHLGQGDDQGVLLIAEVQLEQRSAPYDHERRQHDLLHVDVRN